MHRSAPVDGFSLAYERRGSGTPVVLLHGWPGDHGDWREVAARLQPLAGVGHFSPVEAADRFAQWIGNAL